MKNKKKCALQNDLNGSRLVCRICQGGDMSAAYDNSSVPEPLISPCLCKGTMGLYHRSCLEHWLTTSGTNRCEICHFTFKIGRKFRPFSEFVFDPESTKERKNLMTDLICFVVLTPIAVGCITVCLWACYLQINHVEGWGVSSEDTDWIFCICLTLLALMLSFTYSMWLAATILYHRRTYFQWRLLHEKVFVVDRSSQYCPPPRQMPKRSRFERFMLHFFHRRSIPSFEIRPAPSSMNDADYSRNSALGAIILHPTLHRIFQSEPNILDTDATGEAHATFMASTPLRSQTTTNIPLFSYNIDNTVREI